MPSLRRVERVPPLPPQVREGLGLPRGERVLAHGERAGGGWAIATTAALVLVEPIDGAVPGPGTPSERRWWHDVAEATWDPEARAIEIRWIVDGHPAATEGGRPSSTQVSTLLLGELTGRLPEVLRERVMSTYVLSQRLAVRGRHGVTVAIRRHAGRGTLFAQAVADDGVDVLAPRVVEQVAALTRDLAEQAGLPT